MPQANDYLLEGFRAGERYALAQPPRARGRIGSELGAATGSSLEFMDHREYQPGDDLRRIDWNAFARTDRLTIKLFKEEVRPRLDILLDGSRSMALRGTQKLRAALVVTGLLTAAAENAGYTRHAWLAGEGCRRVESSHGAVEQWQGLSFDGKWPLVEAFAAAPPTWQRNGFRAIISDLLFPADPADLLNPVSDYAAEVVVVQVLAREDTEAPTQGSFQLVDSETNSRREVYVDASLRRRYVENLQQHQEDWAAAARRVGAHMTTVVAETFLADPRLDDLLRAELLRLN
jgi:uncharacterized protein (DUF58 family)